jgi:hypothetical protein
MADFMSSLLQKSFDTQSSPGDATSTFEANPAMIREDQGANVDALIHYLRTGQEPSEMAQPAYGPIGKLLQTIGATSKFKSVSGPMSNMMWLAGESKKGEDEQTRERKLELMQKQGTEFGTASARQLGETLGAPELEQQMGNQLLAAEIRAASAEGNSARLQQLADLQQNRFGLAKEKQEMEPVQQYSQDMIQHLNSRESQLYSTMARIQADALADPNSPVVPRIEAELEKIAKQRSAVLRGRSKFKTPEDIDKALESTTIDTPTTKGGVKPAPKGMFD